VSRGGVPVGGKARPAFGVELDVQLVEVVAIAFMRQYVLDLARRWACR